MNTTTTTIFIDSVACSDELANKLQTDENVWRLTSSKQNPDLASNARFPAFGCVWLRLAAFGTATFIPALDIGYMFPRAWRRLRFFSALSTGCLFSRAWYRFHVLPRLAFVKCYPALSTGCSFPALGTGCLFSGAWHWFHVSPRLSSVIRFPALRTADWLLAFTRAF